MAGVITISSGLIFSQSYSYGFLNLVFVVLVFFVNSWFLSKWLLLLWVCLGERFKVFQQIAVLIALFTFKKDYLKKLLLNNLNNSKPNETEELSECSFDVSDKKFSKRFKIKRKILKKTLKNVQVNDKLEESKEPNKIFEEFSKLDQSINDIHKLLQDSSKQKDDISSKAKSYMIDDNELIDSSV